jgi:glycosyltransferase involved in cell wall biosynthesis
MKKTITIIVAVYNCKKYIEQCLESIVRQTYNHIELIVIDGGSNDGTLEIIKKYSANIAYWCSEKDSGLSDAWNKGVKKSTGEWIYFIGADDYLYNNDVIAEASNKLFNCGSHIRVAYGNIVLTTESGIVLYSLGKPWEESRKQFFSSMSIPHQGVFNRADLFKVHGLFSEEYKITADYEFLMRELKNNDPIYMGDIIVAYMRRGGMSTYRSNSLNTLMEFAKIRRKHLNLMPSNRWYLKLIKELLRILLYQLLGDKVLGVLLNIKLIIQKKPTVWNK